MELMWNGEAVLKIVHVAEPAGGVKRYLESLIFTTGNLVQVMVGSYSINNADRNYHLDIKRSFNPVIQLSTAIKLRHIINYERPDVVFLHSSFAGIVGRIACLGLPCKVFYNPHGWAFDMKIGRFKTAMFRALERIFSLLTDKIILISAFERDSALKNSICAQSKLFVLENAVNVNEFQHDHNEVAEEFSRFINGRFVIGMVGRISEQKGPDVFIEAAGLVEKRIPEAVFCIIGDGSQRSWIESMVKSYGMEGKIYISGWVDDALPYIRKFDIGVLLSRWEGFGLSVAEYMLSEIPIVVTSAGNLANFVERGNSGIVVPVDDPQATSNALIRIRKDAEFASQLGKNGYEFVQSNLNENRFHEEYLQLLKMVNGM